MIDVAIVGAGLTGLALARRLSSQGMEVAVFDARDRIGGRILSVGADKEAVVDLGASWHWPQTEPRMAQLIQDLSLAVWPQPDEGKVLSLVDPNRGPEILDAQHVHGGAMRVSGGMASLVDALAAALPHGHVHLNNALKRVVDGGTHVELHFEGRGVGDTHAQRVLAKRVVLAMPVRLVAQSIQFDPPLPAVTEDALRAVPTWMAREAKAVVRFGKPFWIEEGHSGSAFVSHPQGMLREVWDASDVSGAALAGFVALSPEQREQFSLGMRILVESQLVQLFGQSAQSEDVQIMDWAKEAFTCSDLDKLDPASELPQADPVLRRPHWAGRLYFGGTETARQAAGHMEGALESATRLADFLRPIPVDKGQYASHTDAAVHDFMDWVEVQRLEAPHRYQQHLTRLMSRQDTVQLTQRALLETVEHTYSKAQEFLAAMDCWSGVSDPADCRALVTALLGNFSGFSKALVDEALSFNARSCAMSNFADEHHPSPEYLRVITADLVAAWREFAVSVNDLLHARSAVPA